MPTPTTRMIMLTAIGLLLSALLPAAHAQWKPSPGDTLQTPVFLPGNQVLFRIYAPNAEMVKLAGGDLPSLGWTGKEMTRSSEGIWDITLPVEPGTYRYNFSVDGLTTIDPKNPKTSESNGNTWSLLHQPGAAFMDTRNVPHGALAEVTYWSASLQRFRRLHVYTPPGYENSRKKYPLFYLLHGAGDCDDSWSTVGRAGFILDNLIADGKAVEMVVVMPAGHTGPFIWGAPRGDLAKTMVDEFVMDFTNDIMPLVESRYRVMPGRKHRAIAGLSMGGFQTLNIAIPTVDRFAYAGVFSSGIIGIQPNPATGEATAGPSWEEKYAAQLDNPAVKKGLKLLWFATGREDFLLETSRATIEMLRRHGFTVTYQETAGAHTWINWQLYLNEFAPLLFR
ncbi:MAG TPA: alpha/beta hydrolase-fold protein [bacterium]|nr:alpha/beta hydrolase-fold protein [bacterium]